MTLYLDTEFNGHGGELISMALVGTNGETFYDARYVHPSRLDPWVLENVIPKLDIAVVPDEVFRRRFHDWIKLFDNPEIICDWHADAIHFCEMLEGPDYASSLDFSCRITILKTPPGQPVSANPHNALSDAIALRRWHNAMTLKSPQE